MSVLGYLAKRNVGPQEQRERLAGALAAIAGKSEGNGRPDRLETSERYKRVSGYDPVLRAHCGLAERRSPE